MQKLRNEIQGLELEIQQQTEKPKKELRAVVDEIQKVYKVDIPKLKGLNKAPDSVKLLMEALTIIFSADNKVLKSYFGGQQSIDKYTDFWVFAKKYILNEKLMKIITIVSKDDKIEILPNEKLAKLHKIIDDPLFDSLHQYELTV